MNEKKQAILQMNAQDNVALALDDISQGERFDATASIAVNDIASGHKLAIKPIGIGEQITKYGQAIGRATKDIQIGEHVHIHNVEISAATPANDTTCPPAWTELEEASFEGYLRSDERVGTRNYIGILTSVNCSATVAKKVADSFPDALFEGEENLDGVVAVTHSTGCGMSGSGEAIDSLRRTLAGYAQHPNFAAVLIIGLGCEVNQISSFLSESQLNVSDTLREMTIQSEGGTFAAIETGKAIVEELITLARRSKRQTVSANHLTLGLQCGGSDGWSGVTANPGLGRAADRLVRAGGTVILSETPEIFGAEQLLFARSVSVDVRAKLQERLNWWQDYVARNGAELNNNPSPGNIQGGLTTILEKSLGAVAKSGSSPLVGVYDYAQKIDQRGFVFMDSPGYDPCSATGQTAAGANILSFTTGRGSVFGSKPAPCIKLASNSRLAMHMAEDMDVDCSGVLHGQSLDELGAEIFELLLETASGRLSKSEQLGLGDLEFVPWQLGAVL